MKMIIVGQKVRVKTKSIFFPGIVGTYQFPIKEEKSNKVFAVLKHEVSKGFEALFWVDPNLLEDCPEK
jgi:hypothetical protein